MYLLFKLANEIFPVASESNCLIISIQIYRLYVQSGQKGYVYLKLLGFKQEINISISKRPHVFGSI